MSFQYRRGPIKNLVIVGVGHADWIPTLLDPHATRVLCIEPDPQLAKAVRGHKDQVQDLIHIPAIIGGAAGSASLTTTNIPYVSLRGKSAGLDRIFPGLKTFGTIKIDTIPAKVVLARMVSAYGPNILCVNMLGLHAADISALLAPVRQARPFNDVYIRVCTHSDIAPDQSPDGVKALMASNDYDFVGYAQTDPHFPMLHFVESGLAEKLAQARQEIVSLKDAHKKIQLQANQHRMAAAARSARMIELSEELAEIKLALEATMGELKPAPKARKKSRPATASKD